MVNERIYALQSILTDKNLSAIIVPTQDYHMSEYVGEFFKSRKFLSNFTGSAGVIVVTQTEACLWTDGRYFIQAAQELAGSCIKLQKMGEPGVPTIKKYLSTVLKENDRLCFDGKVMSAKEGKEYLQAFKDKNIELYTSEDIVDKIWDNRPVISCEPAYLFDEKYNGKSVETKLSELRKVMKENRADTHIVTALDDIAWLFNIRGNDVSHSPVVLAYAVITQEQAIFFANKKALGDNIISEFFKIGVEVRDYEDIYEYIKNIPSDKKVMLDTAKVNYSIVKGIKAEILDMNNPETLMKSIKNSVEIENTKVAHIKDCVAVTKFMYWLKTNVGKMKITEVSAQEHLESLRREQESFIDLSFSTIAGYNEHAAMMHYSANEKTDVELKKQGMLLVDSGGHYLDGTTDITRTFVLGDIPYEWKLHFTTVLRGLIRVSAAKFLYGCRGINLDILSRGPLWDIGLDYKCGTGHGVGHLLNVHEGPNGFRWKIVPERNDSCILEEGMITTIEPGVYIEGSHGIRTENELLCRKGDENEYGQFMHFETITFAPIDLDGIDEKLMTKQEKQWLNDYHRQVYDKISPYLTTDEKTWLKEYTKEI